MPAPDLGSMCSDLLRGVELLESLVRPLGERTRTLATPASGWTVHDQITHLAYFDERTVDALEAPQEFRQHRRQVVGDIDGFTDRVASAHRSLSAAAAFERLTEARQRLTASLARVKPGTRVPWYGPDMGVASVASSRLMETWAHTQDILDALEVSEPSTIGLRHVAELCVRAWANGFRAHGLPVPDAPVAVSLSAPDGQHWHWGPMPSENSISGSAVGFCQVATQRRHPSDTDVRARGAVAATGLAVAQAFAGPPGPKRPPRS